VGLVVGRKGGTIKRIQQDTHTYIITPSREREPIFEVRSFETPPKFEENEEFFHFRSLAFQRMWRQRVGRYWDWEIWEFSRSAPDTTRIITLPRRPEL
jgi:hypothetical protein